MKKLLAVGKINQGNLYKPEILTEDFHTTATMKIQLRLHAGSNDIKFYNLPSTLEAGDTKWAPDFRSITVYPLEEGESSKIYSCADVRNVSYIGKSCGPYTFFSTVYGKDDTQIGHVGNNGKNHFVMQNIMVPKDGTYTLDIAYASDELRTFRVGVNNAAPRTKTYTHNFWQIIYYTEGNLELNVNGTINNISEGTIAFIPPNATHSEYTLTGFKGFFFELSHIDEFPEQFFMFKDNPQKILFHLFQELDEVNSKKTYNYQNVLNALVFLIIQYAIIKLDTPSPNKYVNDLANIIHKNLGNVNFKPSDYIKKIPISANYFRLIFKQSIGMSPSEYLTYCRIQMAKSTFDLYHDESDVQIKDVALECGFTDPYYFSRVFKKVVGLSPAQWIKKYALS